MDRGGTAATTTTTPNGGGAQGDPPAPTPTPAPSPATGGTLVDQCSANVSCTIDDQITKKIESCTGHLSEVDGKCFFVRTEGTNTFEDILAAGGSVLMSDGHGVVGVWKSDTAHFVVNIGGGNIVYDCH